MLQDKNIKKKHKTQYEIKLKIQEKIAQTSSFKLNLNVFKILIGYS
jgi:hypothetical protein